MKSQRFWIVATVMLLMAAFGMMAFYANADCNPSDVGTVNDDGINCTITNQPGGTADVQGLEGNDTIVIDSGVNVNVEVYGDSANPGVSGNDTIVNNGNASGMLVGDSDSGANTGSDTIINNGTANYISGDSYSGDGSGNDVIVNNGTVYSGIVGDTITGGTASGNDTITNNGVANNNIMGDGGFGATGGGDDTINNNGTVYGTIYGDSGSGGGGGDDSINNSGYVSYDIDGGDGNDSINNSGTVDNNINAGNGDDTVTITGSGTVGGVMDGGAGYDVLQFNLASSDPEELMAIAEQIAAANPAGGTLTINGIVYTWQNFEQLSTLLLSLVRLNGVGDPLAVFCSLGGGIDVYAVVGNQGLLSLSVSGQALSSASTFAQENGTTVTVANSSSSTVYALSSGEFQVNHPSGFDFTFSYQTRCGELPAAGTFVEEEVETDTFVIINRPR